MSKYWFKYLWNFGDSFLKVQKLCSLVSNCIEFWTIVDFLFHLFERIHIFSWIFYSFRIPILNLLVLGHKINSIILHSLHWFWNSLTSNGDRSRITSMVLRIFWIKLSMKLLFWMLQKLLEAIVSFIGFHLVSIQNYLFHLNICYFKLIETDMKGKQVLDF